MAIIYGEGQLFSDIRKKSFCEQLNALDSKGRQKVLEEYIDWQYLNDADKDYLLNKEVKIKSEPLLSEADLLQKEEPKEMLELSVDTNDVYFYFLEDDWDDEDFEKVRKEDEKEMEEFRRQEKESRTNDLIYGRDDDY